MKQAIAYAGGTILIEVVVRIRQVFDLEKEYPRIGIQLIVVKRCGNVTWGKPEDQLKMLNLQYIVFRWKVNLNTFEPRSFNMIRYRM